MPPRPRTTQPTLPEHLTAQDWARAVLQAGQYPITQSNIDALINWSSYEAGQWGQLANTTSEKNPLSTSLPMGDSTAFNSSGVQGYRTWEDSIKATVAMFKQQNMASISQAFQGGDATTTLPAALTGAQWAGTAPAPNAAYGKTIAGVLGQPAPTGGATANVGGGGRMAGAGVGGGGVDLNALAPKPAVATTTEPGPAGAPTVANMGVTGEATGLTNTGGPGPASKTLAPPMPGVNPADFHGYDLSAIPPDQLGNAEQAIQKYIEDPGYAAQLNQRITQNFGYEGDWVSKVPELQGILIWAATSLDPATAAGQLEFAGAIRDTKWYQSTDANQRAWQQVVSQDPAVATNAVAEAQEKVLATANQIGVTLTKAQLHSIAEMYAANSYTPTGILGTQSGTSQEWLDQAVVSAVTTIKSGRPLPNTTAGAAQMAAPGAAATGANPSQLEQQGPTGTGGLAALLYNDFQQAAQSYLMYNPTNPGQSLMNDQTLMGYVNKALAQYTGTGASGLVSQFATDQTAQFTEQLKEQASKLYPSLAASIAQGVTPQQYVQPISQTIANTLGLNQNSIDFTSPQWSWAIATPDPKTGVKTALTQDQILQKITSPSFTFTSPSGQPMTFDNTNTAMQNAHSMISTLAGVFGTGGD